MMMTGGTGGPSMAMRMPMGMRTQMPGGRVIPGPGEIRVAEQEKERVGKKGRQ